MPSETEREALYRPMALSLMSLNAEELTFIGQCSEILSIAPQFGEWLDKMYEAERDRRAGKSSAFPTITPAAWSDNEAADALSAAIMLVDSAASDTLDGFVRELWKFISIEAVLRLKVRSIAGTN